MKQRCARPGLATRTGWVSFWMLGLVLAAGCLGEPEIDERWTLVELVSSSPGPGARLPADRDIDIRVRGRITYRDIETGFLVAEARYAENLDRRGMGLDPDVHDLGAALEIERILENSVTAGRATKAVTGFDHLMQTVDLAFTARVPAALGNTPPDSVLHRGLFLVLYLGEGDEIELQDGRDSLVVTPFRVEETEVLFTGHLLDVDQGGGGP
jgi:hypothetical protein